MAIPCAATEKWWSAKGVWLACGRSLVRAPLRAAYVLATRSRFQVKHRKTEEYTEIVPPGSTYFWFNKLAQLLREKVPPVLATFSGRWSVHETG